MGQDLTFVNHTVVAEGFRVEDSTTNVVSATIDANGLTLDAGDLTLGAAGAGINIDESGAAARMGIGTLNGATEVTVNTTAVTANSRIFLTEQDPNGGTQSGRIFVSSRVPGTSFGVTSVALDVSTFAWLIIEPA